MCAAPPGRPTRPRASPGAMVSNSHASGPSSSRLHNSTKHRQGDSPGCCSGRVGRGCSMPAAAARNRPATTSAARLQCAWLATPVPSASHAQRAPMAAPAMPPPLSPAPLVPAAGPRATMPPGRSRNALCALLVSWTDRQLDGHRPRVSNADLDICCLPVLQCAALVSAAPASRARASLAASSTAAPHPAGCASARPATPTWRAVAAQVRRRGAATCAAAAAAAQASGYLHSSLLTHLARLHACCRR